MSNDRTLRLWDAGTWQEVLTVSRHAQSILSVTFSGDGRRLSTGGDDRAVVVWDGTPWKNDWREVERGCGK